MKSSIRSLKSGGSSKFTKSVAGEDVMQLEDYLTMACKKFQCPYPVAVRKTYQRDDFLKLKDEPAAKYKKINMAPMQKDILVADLERGDDKTSSRTTTATYEDEDTIPITVIYDNKNNLVEISLSNVKKIPRVLIQLICAMIPFYEQFAKMSIQKCCLNPYTIHEINKILPVTTITDLCFDGSPFNEANFAILLKTSSTLSNLSLSRCKINDEVCKQIASQLHFSMPAENNLSTLNLSSNRITNEGAKHISEALRSNRNLRYLNLADNNIGDDGAEYIFDTLKDFPMSPDEITSMRRRFLEHLKVKRDVYSKYVSELNTASKDDNYPCSKKNIKKKTTSATSLKTKSHADRKGERNKSIVPNDCISANAEIFPAEVMGPFHDPFNSNSTKIQHGYSYCCGNMVLCYLNLSYNNLSFWSVVKLQDVLIYQSALNKLNQPGLIRVMIEGNAIPDKCDEMNTISDLLAKSIALRVQSNQASKRQRQIINLRKRQG